MKNEKIKSNLIKLEKEYTLKLKSFFDLDKLVDDLLNELENFDFESYKVKLKKELIENLNQWWINPKKGIVKEEELFAILLEYGHFFSKEVEAEAYGIGEWKDYKVQFNKFDMGFDYDFTTEFYASPGITLDFFDSLEKLDYSNLPEKYEDDDIIDVKGFYELVELYKVKGYLAIHNVLLEMDSEGSFETLNYKNNFMFIIDEHDSGEVYPLLIKNK